LKHFIFSSLICLSFSISLQSDASKEFFNRVKATTITTIEVAEKNPYLFYKDAQKCLEKQNPAESNACIDVVRKTIQKEKQECWNAIYTMALGDLLMRNVTTYTKKTIPSKIEPLVYAFSLTELLIICKQIGLYYVEYQLPSNK
jgi:hypothetical protein